jgi:MFS family permease
MFFLGMSVSVATARMAEIKGATHSSDSAFGYAVLIGNLGIMIGNYLGGIAVHRIGSRAVIRIAILGIAGSQIGYGFAHHLWQISMIAFIAGLCGSFSNVGVNMQGGMIESGIGRSLLPTFHGAWTLGAFSASLLSSVVASHISLQGHLLINCIFSFLGVSAAALVLLSALVDQEVLVHPDNQPDEHVTQSKINPAVAFVAFCASLALLSEASVGDWAGILLHEKFHVTLALSALGYTFFALGQIIGRFTIGKRIDRIGVVAVIRTGGILGGVIYLVSPVVVNIFGSNKPTLILTIMCVQYFVLGLCIAPMPPAFAILAYRIPNISSAKSLAQMQIIGAFGFMLGRFILSTLTHLFGLQGALLLPALTLLATGLLARKLSHE